MSTPLFRDKIREAGSYPLVANDISVLQVNLGYRCNMSCRHCHVEARPDRDQIIDDGTVQSVLRALKTGNIKTLDITGGAPEMNPHFRYLVEEADNCGCHIVVRTNLTIFFEQGMGYLPEFVSSHSAEVVASMPHYSETGVDRIRGKGTFEKCIIALQLLNRLGYGKPSGEKKLNLVYNPAGAFLSPAQKTLEDDFKRELAHRFGISFDRLYTFTNMPIGRFRDYLIRTDGLEKYMDKLVCSFNPQTIPGLMCRNLISVGWDGRLHDCDFNQVLGLGVSENCPQDVREFDYSLLAGRTVSVGDHCYACTAGQGST